MQFQKIHFDQHILAILHNNLQQWFSSSKSNHSLITKRNLISAVVPNKLPIIIIIRRKQKLEAVSVENPLYPSVFQFCFLIFPAENKCGRKSNFLRRKKKRIWEREADTILMTSRLLSVQFSGACSEINSIICDSLSCGGHAVHDNIFILN